MQQGVTIHTGEISFVQAVLGDNIKVETIDGVLEVKVPEGTEHGQPIRLKGKGIPHLNRNSRGDHYVKIKIRVPKKISCDARKKLEDLKGDL